MSYGRHQFDVPHALASDFLFRYLNATAIADNTLIPDALILAAMTFPIFNRTKDAFAEQTPHLRLVRPVVDGFGLRNFTVRTLEYRLGRRQTNGNLGKVVVDLFIFSERHAVCFFS